MSLGLKIVEHKVSPANLGQWILFRD